jgi:phosphoglycolate phosphatase (TIGR01487 family)
MRTGDAERIRFLVTDIDGTITDSSGRIDLESIQLLRDLEGRGVSVGLVSGRPFPMVLLLGEYIGLSGPSIGENGGVFKFKETTEILGSRVIAEEAVRELRESFTLTAAWDNDWRVSDYALEPSNDVSAIRSAIAELHLNVELQVSSIMMHIGKKEVTKRTALERWLEISGASAGNVLVAGDSDSDLPMFEAFPRSIAPSTSTDGILRLAAYRARAGYALGFREGVRHYCAMGGIELLGRRGAS